MEGLCLTGFTSVPYPDAFCHFPEFRSWDRVFISPSFYQELLGAWGNCSSLFTGPPNLFLLSTPDTLGNLSFLQHLVFLGPCLHENLGVQLPSSLCSWLPSRVAFRMWGSWLTSSQIWYLAPPLAMLGSWTYWTCLSPAG